jgi:hypothetical protein
MLAFAVTRILFAALVGPLVWMARTNGDCG